VDDPKEETHECVEHGHNLVIVEDCSTSWSSDDDDNDRSTTSSLDKMEVMPQVMQMLILPQAHLVMVMMVHARGMIVML
jgi:hypothetical protein